MSEHKNTYAVIMAGGVGTRFWPMSKSSRPKQFLDILGTGKSLIQMTYSRLIKSISEDNILVVTNLAYRSMVAKHLPNIPENNILCEPCLRNTAPCIAYANSVIAERISKTGADSEKTAIVVAPSDHLIMDELEFGRILDLATERASNSSSIITLGIEATRPDTGYGYIKYSSESENSGIALVKRFTEKPNLKTAEKFLSEGSYCWNSGIFIWSLATINKEFRKQLPKMQTSFDSIKLSGKEGEVDCIYEGCESISIDYGIIENADSVSVIPCNFGWSDLGTWTSLSQHLETDDSNNASSSVELVASESKGNVIVGSSDKTVAIKGLNNFIVVDTEDALLICPKSEEQWVKTLVGELNDRSGKDQ